MWCLGYEVGEWRVGCDVEERAHDRDPLEVLPQDWSRLLGLDLLDSQPLRASSATHLDLTGGSGIANPANLAVGRDEPAL